MSNDVRVIYTIGHSNHEMAHFVGLLCEHSIDVLVDVRSSPYSRYADWFNREPLQEVLVRNTVKYIFMGDLIGGRPDSDEFYDADGHVRYDLLASSEPFRRGIERLRTGAKTHRIAIMCGEEDPTDCHRNLLIGRVLQEGGIHVLHIRGDGRLEERTEPLELSLFGDEGGPAWRSTQSVSRRSRPRNSSDS